MRPYRQDVSSLCLESVYFGTRSDQPTSFRLLDQYMVRAAFR
jgi:hypothetical protein